MSYDGKIMHRALRRFEDDRRLRQEAFHSRQEEIYAREPRLREIQAQLGGTMARLISSALRRGTDPRAQVTRLRDQNLALQRERRELLADMGLPEDALEEKPACPLCGDTGYRGEAVCRCLRRYYVQEQKAELSRMLNLGDQSFERFSFEWYSSLKDPRDNLSPRENMEVVYDVCVDFARHFRPGAGNLLLFGPPGLGKTFLSACIAREVSDRGYSVVYDTASHIFSSFERWKFGRDEPAGEDVNRALECDLLILDDLGTEMTTAFVVSALYEILNTRLLTNRSTIVSTNLMPPELATRYSPQIASRIEGEYRHLPFFGQDIRQLKRQKEQGS